MMGERESGKECGERDSIERDRKRERRLKRKKEVEGEIKREKETY
jgi:hypothetical protein